jgi:NTE family protein
MIGRPGRARFLAVVTLVLVSGCGGVPVVAPDNLPWQAAGQPSPAYDPGEVIVWLALSGGGTRAAALAYGVMERLDEIAVTGEDGRPGTLLREVDYISSVSGGSFAAAFYALNRDRADWKAEFRRRVLNADLETAIGRQLIEPTTFLWVTLTNYTRSQVAADYYNAHIFKGKRFRDLPPRPKLILNSSDLVTGRRFEFTPEDFACLRSDLSGFRIAEAVTASSAFPGAFPSVLLANHGPHAQCPNAAAGAPGPPCMTFQQEAAEQFIVKESRRGDQAERDFMRNPLSVEREKKLKYCNLREAPRIHLSDGGLTDNLGVDAFLVRAEDPGLEIHPRIFQGRAKTVVIISVNAATAPDEDLGRKPEGAWFGKILLRGIDLFLERRALESLEGVRERVYDFERRVREEQPDFRMYFLEVTFEDIQDPGRRHALQNIGTRLHLPPDQVKELIAAGRELIESGRNGDNGRDLAKIRKLFDSREGEAGHRPEFPGS